MIRYYKGNAVEEVSRMDWLDYSKQAIYILLACGVGIGAGVSDLGGGSITIPVLISIVYTAIRVGSQWYRENKTKSWQLLNKIL